MESPSLVLCAAILSIGSVAPFNVDMENFVQYQGPANSMFGFSVAEYQGWDHNWVLVGAPAAQTDQPGVLRGGAVFRCHSSDDRCQAVTFDPSGNTRNSSGHEIDKKSRQWFGATVHTSGGSNGVIVACAPRYTYFSQSAPEYREDPVGTCYVARDDFRTFLEYSPCRTAEWGYHRQGSCQAGLGAAVSKDGQRLFIGAPGSWYWQGRLYSVNSKVKLDWFYPIYNFSYPPGRLYSQNLNEHLRPDVITTLEGPKEDDDSYLGYSVAGGDFTGDGDNGAAVGMPRGAMLFGKVILFSSQLTHIGEFRGEQLGAYFGYSVCVADVDGDNLDDLIVGAPMFTHLHNNEGKYETGRIHIMYQKKDSKWFQDSDFRDGKNSKSRFGLSLCSLGDINKDGFGDIAVGAPYDGPKGGGAVYLYHGSEKGLMKDPSQIIYGETFSPSISTFGFSISGGNDLDNNEYPDIVIGAYEKDLAFFFKSRPIVKMKSDIKVGPESKLISLDDKNCVLRDGTLTTCTFVSLCMEYNGIGVEPRHEFEIQLTLDSKKQKSPRMFFRTNEGLSSRNFTVTLEQRNRKCNRHEVYIKPGIKDKLTALEVEMRYELRYSRRRQPRSLLPILDQGRPAVEHDSISIQKNCGPDNICIPDLNLSATPSVSKYLLGSGERFDIEAKVVNYGEDAFESIFNLRIPPGLNFTRIERLPDDDREIPVQCSAPDAENNNTLKCDIGNPLPKHKHVHFKVLMQPFYKENLKSRYEFYVEVNSTNPENKSSTKDNKKEFSVPIIINSDISISGSSSPIELYYNTTHYNVVNVTQESEIGPQLNHSYTILNTGPSDIVEAEVYILWPMYTLEGEPLFYILEQPEVDGPAVCEKLEEANSLKLQLDQRRKSGIKQAHTGKFSKSSESGTRISVKETSHSKGSAASSGKWKENNFEDKGTDNSKSKSNGRDSSTSYEHQNRNAEGNYGATRNEKEQSYFQNRSSGGWSGGPAKDGQFHGYSSYNYSYSVSEGGKPTKHYSNYSVTTYRDGSHSGASTNWSSENTNDKNANVGYSESENKQKTSSLSGSSSEVTGSSFGSESQIGGVRFIPAIKRTGVGYDAVTVSGTGGFRTGVIDSHGGVNPFSTNTGSSHHTTLDEISRTQAGQANSQEGSHYYSSTWSTEGSSRSESSRKQGSSDNSKQIVRHYSSNTGNDGEVRHYNPSTDIAWEERYRHTIDSGKNSHTNDDYNNEDDLDDEYEESYSEEETTNTNNNDNNNRDSETDKNLKLYSRYTREVNGEDNFDQLLECNSTQCVKFKCSIKRFTRGQEININIRSRVWVQTLKKISFNVPANVSSMLAMQVTKLPYIGQPDNPIIRSYEVFTSVISTDTTIKPDIVPLWVVVLSACAGAIILLLLILLLWKCGFFKRNRPTDAPEKEPLNRNGHYSNGDEAL